MFLEVFLWLSFLMNGSFPWFACFLGVTFLGDLAKKINPRPHKDYFLFLLGFFWANPRFDGKQRSTYLLEY